MASKLDIINLALLRIGESPIQSLTEGSTPANTASLLYDNSRKAILRDFDWNFAMKTAALATVESDVAGCYAFVVPADCLRVVEVFQTEGEGGRRSSVWFRVYGKKIYTHENVPYVKYVRDEENTNYFDSKFTEALTYKLAGELAMSVKQSESLMASMLNAFQNVVATAATESQDEYDPALIENPYVEVRYAHS